MLSLPDVESELRKLPVPVTTCQLPEVPEELFVLCVLIALFELQLVIDDSVRFNRVDTGTVTGDVLRDNGDDDALNPTSLTSNECVGLLEEIELRANKKWNATTNKQNKDNETKLKK